MRSMFFILGTNSVTFNYFMIFCDNICHNCYENTDIERVLASK